MAVIVSGNHPKALWPGIHAWFGREYSKHPLLCTQIFDVQTSRQAYEEDVRVTGFGMAPVKSEGGSVAYADESQAETTRYTHVTYGLGYIVTQEEMEDNLYEVVSKRRAQALGFSMRTTKETVSSNVLDRATNGSYTGGDGVSLLSTAHPSLAGDQSNTLATAADLSEAALEDILIQIKNAENYRGLKINIMPRRLIVAPANQFEAERILKSTLRVDTANNDVNAIRNMGLLPDGALCNPYLTDADQWFVQTDAPRGLTCFMRRAMSFTRDNDFDTENAKAKATERYSFGWSDWLGVYGSEGA